MSRGGKADLSGSETGPLSTLVTDYVARIRAACVGDVARETPFDAAPRLAARLHNRVLLKREDLQPTFSFKLRGAYAKISSLTDAQAERGVIAASAGNHAQGVALACQRRGVRAVIVMPRTTPEIKVDAVRELGGEVVLHGDSYDDAYARSLELEAEHGLTYVHPYDDPEVIAGQGTVAVEMLAQTPEPLDAVFVPVGGGGLLAGIAAYVRASSPNTEIIGVEPEGAACLEAALRAGEPVTLDDVDIFADGVAVRRIGAEPFRVIAPLVDQVVTVSTDEVCAAIMHLYEDTRSIAEPAGALAVAGLAKYVQSRGIKDRTLAAIVTGANASFHRLRYVSERVELGEKREVILAVTIPERPGSFLEFCQAIGNRSITEFNYRYGDPEVARVYVGVRIGGDAGERERLVAEVESTGYEVVDLTDSELAKNHVRYLVGGRPRLATRERVFSFDFPERPGALRRFLDRLPSDLNITLFHYRNHGAAIGRVLVGLQQVGGDGNGIDAFLDRVGYSWREEGDDPAYRLFLG
jgi:threonine dehydratase